MLALLLCATASLSVVPLASAAQHGRGRTHRHHAHGHRVGGTVHKAWPERGRKPATRQARWLARQVGATEPRPCATRRRQARKRCHVTGKGRALRRGSTAAAAMNVTGGDPGSPPGQLARIADGFVPPRRTASTSADGIALPLQLVRSYEIPVGDPSYNRLLDWSWTYDSAVAAAAFAASGDKANAAQLLDQLAALQYTDGSLEIAFDTATGEGAQVFRSGTVAWLGLAATTYDQAFGSSRYLDSEQRAADYLLTLQLDNGLIRGGPDVKWISTQHNLIAYVFLSRLAAELRAAGSTAGAARYQTAATAIAKAIDANLLVSDASGTHFLQGLGDTTPALDVQALGAMYLQGTGQPKLAAEVLAYAQRTFAVDNRAIKASSEPATYNMTYEAPGPFAGYAPYAGAGAPDVLWAEGSGEMRMATAALGQDTGALDKRIAEWSAVTKSQGALQANRTIRTDAYEYHVWPASTTSAWTVLAQSAPAFFAAPLPATSTLITNWTKIRGGNLITTFPDGRVDMLLSGGERRVHAASTASDYTITANATLRSGAGYGIYARATVDAAAKLTGYCIQLDHAYGTGQIVVRQLISDAELGVPIAHVNVPAGFAWYGVPHTVGVTLKGNTMNVTIDGGQALNVPDLATASAFSVKYAYGTTTYPAPASGGYGLRAWGDGLVSLQQMIVGAS